MKKHMLLLLLCNLLLSLHLFAQDNSAFEKKIFVVNKDTMPYRLLLPLNYNPAKKYPLVIFLHGSGERGNDNESQLVHGSKLFLSDSVRTAYPAIVVFPQCAANSFWSNVTFNMVDGKRNFIFTDKGTPTKAMDMLQKLVYNLIKDYPVQKKQVYVGGLSMGGMGTLELINRNPTLFAAAFSICGGADTLTAKNIAKIPLWLFHGGKDDVVPSQLSVKMAEALMKLKAPVKLTIYPNDNHNSWDSTFAEPALLSWLFSNKKRGK